MKIGYVIAGILLILAGAAVIAGVLAANGFNLPKIASQEIETHTYDFSEEIKAVSVSTTISDVTLKPSDDGVTHVICEEIPSMKHTVEVKDGVLSVTSADDGSLRGKLSLLGNNLSVTIMIPEGRLDSVDISATTGGVELTGVETGTLKLTNSTGSARLSGVKADTVDVSESTGSVRAENVECSGKISVGSNTGSITLKDVNCGELSVSGKTGSAKLSNVTASGAIDVRLTTGSVALDKTDAGSLSIHTSTGSVKGTLRSGKEFRTSTTTGSVSVPQSTSGGGLCEITTTTGSIGIRIE